MPGLRPASPVVAVVVGDLHLSDKPPTARAEETEDDWFAAMGQVLEELCAAAGDHECPLVVAGDLFDVPKPSPKLITFACRHLRVFPYSYAVAGQHDLPNHSQDKLDESALGVLAATGCVTMLDPNDPVLLRGVYLYGAGWGQQAVPVLSGRTAVLVSHKYVWQDGHAHHGALEKDRVLAVSEALARNGYTSAVFGDNHSGFEYSSPDGKFQAVNGGVAVPRNADFTDYAPCYTLVHASGRLSRVPLNTKPRWQAWAAAGTAAKEEHAKILKFAEHLAALVGPRTREDFLDELRGHAARLEEPDVRKHVHSIIARVREELK